MELDRRRPGAALWPERFSAAIRATIGPTKWAALYQQEPRPEGGAEWPADWFGPEIWFDEWPRAGNRIMALDPSKGRGDKWGDYSALVKLVYADGCFWVDADLANDRNIALLVEQAVEAQRQFRAEAFGVEVNQFQEMLADSIVARGRELGIPLPIYMLDNRVNKDVRIRRLTPYLAQRQMRFKGGSAGAQLLVRQLMDFPNGEHDDGPDALEMAVRVLGEVLHRPTTEPFEAQLTRILERI